MEKVSIVNLDLGKWSFQAHGALADSGVGFHRKLSREKVLGLYAEQPRCIVAMEACGELMSEFAPSDATAGQTQCFLSAHDQINSFFHLCRDHLPAVAYRTTRGRASRGYGPTSMGLLPLFELRASVAFDRPRDDKFDDTSGRRTCQHSIGLLWTGVGGGLVFALRGLTFLVIREPARRLLNNYLFVKICSRIFWFINSPYEGSWKVTWYVEELYLRP